MIGAVPGTAEEDAEIDPLRIQQPQHVQSSMNSVYAKRCQVRFMGTNELQALFWIPPIKNREATT